MIAFDVELKRGPKEEGGGQELAEIGVEDVPFQTIG